MTGLGSKFARGVFALAFYFLLSDVLNAAKWAPQSVPAELARDAQRAEWLTAEIARHDELYFKKAAPEISDVAYDQLKRELRALQEKHPHLASRETRIGDDRGEGFATYWHGERMLSLNKAYTEAEVRAFHAKIAAQTKSEAIAFTVEPKYDGLAISVTYEQGRLVRAVTRGNGLEGDEVTENLLTILSLPRELRRRDDEGKALPLPELVEVRGEVYLSFAEFARINDEREAVGEAPFAHPRNLAAGTLKQQSSAEVAKRKLEVVFYGVGVMQPVSVIPATQRELHALIQAWGLPGLAYRVAKTSDELWSAVQTIGAERGRLPFPTDGVVVKLDATAQQRKLGESDSAPNWALAYKFSTERAETRLKAITLQVGRSGVLTPVAELETVELGGSKITRASLHNRDEIARKDIRIGDYVFVEKAGEIIPAVVGVNFARRTTDSAKFVFPEKCPACQAEVIAISGEAAVHCPNAECPAQVQQRIEHFVSKDCVEISGFGPALIGKLVARGWLKNVADIYQLEREQLLTLGGNVEKSTDRLLAAIERSKGASLWRVIHGLSIPQVGAVTSRELAAKFGRLEVVANASEEALRARGVDRSVAASVADFFAKKENQTVVRRIMSAGVATELPQSTVVANSAFTGKIFVFTGTLLTLSRTDAADKVRAAGAIVRDNVSKQTDYLVVGVNGGSKLKTAQELSVKIIDEAEFLQLLGK